VFSDRRITAASLTDRGKSRSIQGEPHLTPLPDSSGILHFDLFGDEHIIYCQFVSYVYVEVYVEVLSHRKFSLQIIKYLSTVCRFAYQTISMD